MKLKNRLLSLLMALVMIFSTTVSLAETITDDVADEELTGTQMPDKTDALYGKLLLLEKLGFFEDMYTLELDATVTRGQYAIWLEKAANLTGIKAYTTTEFSDIPKSGKVYAAIQNVVSAGYMSGMGGSVFMPNATIKLSDVAVSLVRLTGKEAYAVVKGGYPTGYEQVARQIGLYNGVKYGTDTTVNILCMIYNALNADYLEPNSFSDKGVMYLTGKTVLNFFHNIYSVEGTMSANGYTKTYSDDVILNHDSIEIDRIVYDCHNTELNELLGMHINGFYHWNEATETRELISAYADEKDNTVLTLPSKGLDVRGQELYYPIDDGARVKKVNLKVGFEFIYNNRANPARANEDVEIADGEITLIDKDNDRVFDTVIAKDRVTDRITGIDSGEFAIYAQSNVIKKADNDAAVIIIKKVAKDGSILEIGKDAIAIDSVVTIYRSYDNMYIEVIVCENKVQGTPTSWNDEMDTLIIDDAEYEFARLAAVSDVILGRESEFLLDYLGRISYVSKATNTEYTYGYVFKVYYDWEIEKEVVRLLTSSGEKRYSVYDKVTIDGNSGCQPVALETALSPNTMIRFRLDKNEMIRGVDTLAAGTRDERHDKLTRETNNIKLKYNVVGKSIGDYAQYRIGTRTFFMQAPTDVTETQDYSKYLPVAKNLYQTDREYNFSVYDWDPETFEAGAIIYHCSEKVSAPSLNEWSQRGVVEKVFRIWEDGEDVYKISMMCSTGVVEYTISDRISRLSLNDLTFGDQIRFGLDTDGKIGSFRIDLDASTESPASSRLNSTSSDDEWRYSYGKVIGKQKDYLLVEEDNGNVRGTFPINGVSKVFLVDMAERKISTIATNNVSTYMGDGTPSYVYGLISRNANTSMMSVYKY